MYLCRALPYLNQCWIILNFTPGTTIQISFRIQILKRFIRNYRQNCINIQGKFGKVCLIFVNFISSIRGLHEIPHVLADWTGIYRVGVSTKLFLRVNSMWCVWYSILLNVGCLRCVFAGSGYVGASLPLARKHATSSVVCKKCLLNIAGFCSKLCPDTINDIEIKITEHKGEYIDTKYFLTS